MHGEAHAFTLLLNSQAATAASLHFSFLQGFLRKLYMIIEGYDRLK